MSADLLDGIRESHDDSRFSRRCDGLDDHPLAELPTDVAVVSALRVEKGPDLRAHLLNGLFKDEPPVEDRDRAIGHGGRLLHVGGLPRVKRAQIDARMPSRLRLDGYGRSSR